MDPDLTVSCHIVELDGTGLDVEWGSADGTVFPAHYDEVGFVSGADLQGYLSRQVVNAAGEHHALTFSGPAPWFETNERPAPLAAESGTPETSETADGSPPAEVVPPTEEGTPDVAPQAG